MTVNNPNRPPHLAPIGDQVAVVGQELQFTIHATDIDGFQNTAVEEYELVVRPDQNPTVQIENPRRNEDRTPVAVVPFQAVAEDGEIRSLEAIEADMIRLALGRYRGHMTEVAKRLNIGRSTLYRKMQEYGLEPRTN